MKSPDAARDEGQLADRDEMKKERDTSQRVPLRERTEDILPLARQYIKFAEEHLGTEAKELSKEAEEYILSRDWPGEERELETAVRRACILGEEGVLTKEDFDLNLRQAKSIGRFIEDRLKGFMRNIKKFEKFNLYAMVIPEVERSLIMMVLKETKGNQIRASQLLGINRNTLRNKIKQLGIDVRS